jgi:formylglycine-generating enzyme required for sulfatase activity
LLFSAPGRADVRYPVLVRRGEQRRISFELPYAASIPEGFVYIPPGPFLFGSLQPPTIRKDFLFTVPLHEVTTGAYLIAEHETTFGDWLEYLNALGPAEALRRAAELTGPRKGQLSLRPVAQDWELTLRLNSREHVMRLTDHFHIPERKARQDQDWRLLPVVGVSMAEINDYLFWRQNFNLSIRPRLCSEFEWERAARGADGREYPHGNLVFARDANCGDTYGGKATTIGPDEVGAFSASRSPFVVDDMCGNAAEFTRSSLQEGEYVLRGGSYAETINQIRSTNRQVVLGTDRSLTVGVRLCADLK